MTANGFGGFCLFVLRGGGCYENDLELGNSGAATL